MSLQWVTSPSPGREGPEPTSQVPLRSPRRKRGRLAAASDGRPPRTLLPTSDTDQWVPLGPAATMRGQADLNPRVSGRARALAVSDDGRRAYVGTAQGGVWFFSEDTGPYWLPLDHYSTTPRLDGKLGEANALAVGSVLVKFGTAADGSQDEVYVGTGEQRAHGFKPLPGEMQGVGIRRAVGPAPQVRAGGPTANPWTLEATNIAGGAVLRMAFDARAGVVWAATTVGLFRRPAAGDVTTWEAVDPGLPRLTITDVLVTIGEAGEAQRIYVASDMAQVAWSVTGDPPWHHIALADSDGSLPAVSRVALAKGNVPGHPVVYALADDPRLWRIQADAAFVVSGLPATLFGGQASYDMAIAGHPSAFAIHRDRLVVGGGAILVNGDYNACLYEGRVTQDAAGKWTFPGTTSFIGLGVHPDVHALSWVNGPATAPPQLWAACDGGVFRSANDAAPGSFTACNTGLASLEAQYLGQHPATDAIVFVGTQDNGTLRRVSSTTWVVARESDGGGVAIDPVDPRRVMAQYVQSAWNASTDGGSTFATRPPMRATPSAAPPKTAAKYLAARNSEIAASAFYSSSAAIDVGGGETHLAVGTDRVWLTTDWGTSWVTLPSLKDPYAPTTPGAPDRALDALDPPGRVFALRWGSPTRLYALTGAGVYRYTRELPAWTRTRLYDRAAVESETKDGIPPDFQVPFDTPMTDLVPHEPGRGVNGSLYVGTTGSGTRHVWWFDGGDRWLDTTLTLDSPVHAVMVDPDHPEVVYAGSDVGVYKGVGTFPAAGGGDPHWDWQPYGNGLPEAACIDLAIHAPTRLLRAALRGRGVWELALDGVKQVPEAYIRAHAYDTRRRPVPSDARDPLGDPKAAAPLRLDASPDLRVYRAPGTPYPPISRFPLGNDSFDLWVTAAALRAKGVRVPVDGRWTTPIYNAIGGAAAPLTIAQWNALVAGPQPNVLPFDHDPPDAGDIAVNLFDEPDRRPGAKASCATGDGAVRIFAVVHGRDWRPLPSTRIAVFLLRTEFSGNADLSGTPVLPPDWAVGLKADLTAPTPGGWLAGSDWAYVDPAHPFRRPPRALDARESQVVRFDTALSNPAWPDGGWLLLAVVVADDDLVHAPETDVATLVRHERHVAARSVRRFA